MNSSNLNPGGRNPTLLSLPDVLQRYPVSRSVWLTGVKDGMFPKPVRLSAWRVAWRASDIYALIASLETV